MDGAGDGAVTPDNARSWGQGRLALCGASCGAARGVSCGAARRRAGAGAEGQRAAMVAGGKGTARARGQGGYRRYEQDKMGPVNHGLLTGPTAYRSGKRFVHPTGLLREGSDDATRRATRPL